MTGGKILYIDKNGNSYMTTEFNGDMYPEGRAAEITDRFEEGYFENFNLFQRFVEHFNKIHFGYSEELIGQMPRQGNQIVDVTQNRTDYLYLINESSETWIILDRSGTAVFMPHSLIIVHFQQVNKMIRRNMESRTDENGFELSKEEFVSIIHRLRDSSDLVDNVNTLFHNSRENVECDFCNGAALQISHESIVIFLLKKLMRDRYENIEYFIYELDYGRNYEPGMISDDEDQPIDLSSAGKLYDYIYEINHPEPMRE